MEKSYEGLNPSSSWSSGRSDLLIDLDVEPRHDFTALYLELGCRYVDLELKALSLDEVLIQLFDFALDFLCEQEVLVTQKLIDDFVDRIPTGLLFHEFHLLSCVRDLLLKRSFLPDLR